MQQANEALYKYSGPWFPSFEICTNCSPFRAFGTVIVNHTAGRDELVCSGANNVTNSGDITQFVHNIDNVDPTQHGEINGDSTMRKRIHRKGIYSF